MPDLRPFFCLKVAHPARILLDVGSSHFHWRGEFFLNRLLENSAIFRCWYGVFHGIRGIREYGRIQASGRSFGIRGKRIQTVGIE